MKLHLPSLLLGIALGAGAVIVAKRLRPLLLELATAGYRVVDAVATRVEMTREDVDDLFAEARARVRGSAVKKVVPVEEAKPAGAQA